MVMVAFVMVAVLDHLGSWDPIWAAIKKIYRLCRCAVMEGGREGRRVQEGKEGGGEGGREGGKERERESRKLSIHL